MIIPSPGLPKRRDMYVGECCFPNPSLVQEISTEALGVGYATLRFGGVFLTSLLEYNSFTMVC